MLVVFRDDNAGHFLELLHGAIFSKVAFVTEIIKTLHKQAVCEHASMLLYFQDSALILLLVYGWEVYKKLNNWMGGVLLLPNQIFLMRYILLFLIYPGSCFPS